MKKNLNLSRTQVRTFGDIPGSSIRLGGLFFVAISFEGCLVRIQFMGRQRLLGAKNTDNSIKQLEQWPKFLSDSRNLDDF